ncbi:MAG: hypothetical protein C4297_04005 [Gemmataceae bacterium]
MWSRREFLRSCVASSSLVAVGLSIPRFLSRTAAATLPADKSGGKDTLLVVVQLTGGNDGLNTVVPFKDPLYAKYRQALRLPLPQLHKIEDDVALHPSLKGFAELLDDGALCVVQGVGYPNPSQSHFRSMDIWHAGSMAENPSEGWLGKTLRQLSGSQAFHIAQENEEAPLALSGSPGRVPSLTRLEDFRLHMRAAHRGDLLAQRKVLQQASAGTSSPGLLDFIQRTATQTYAQVQRLQELAQSYEPRVPYPASGLAQRLKLVAQLIDAEVGARIFYVSLDGFDTHAEQLATHGRLLQELSDAVTAFFKDMSARGHRDRIVLMTFSEFGRRVAENGSKGTDHGAAAPMFLVGGRVHAGVVGNHPSLADLDMGNLKHHTDFRQVYAAVLDQWLGVSSRQVLGSAFRQAPVLQTRAT